MATATLLVPGLVTVDLYRWAEKDEDGNRIVREATRGSIVDVPAAEYDRGLALGALVDPGESLSARQRLAQMEQQALEAERRAKALREQVVLMRASLPDSERIGDADYLTDEMPPEASVGIATVPEGVAG